MKLQQLGKIEPDPDHGWSREIVQVHDAVVVPPTTMIGRPICGVVSDLGDCPHAATWRGGIRMTRAVTEKTGPGKRLKGKHMWGGLYYGHFGHFMTETMSRCWAFDHDEIETVIFVPKHPDLQDFQKYQSEFWELLNLKVKVTIAREPISVEELYVPGQGFGLGRIAKGTPEFRARMRQIAERLPADNPRKIYISRTKFNGRGGIVAESVMERNMIRNGYEIMHPEKMALTDQLRYYKSASHILGVDSSAFHIAGMVADPSKNIGFILRRDNNAHESIAAQIQGMIGRDPEIIDALAANWMDPLQDKSNHLSWGEIDHGKLALDLVEKGFIDSAEGWESPSEEEIATSVEEASKRAKVALTRSPRDVADHESPQ
ncbi:glycosyltransferase family 61 protein [Paracoccus denitrificans]|uniref:glycosyltransferase family 61 protein n=1 Tax=Paracoccus denitrificans TaxID=266 RepID=UPI001E43D7A8|nr:glycosyltransferase family 61 protein [Paracoccus denitrificans]UFS65358.1 glycosyltransferase family 61 protein [Paracoccus denitrificans]